MEDKNMTTNNPLLKVVAAEYVRDYTLRLTFNTGVTSQGVCPSVSICKYHRK